MRTFYRIHLATILVGSVVAFMADLAGADAVPEEAVAKDVDQSLRQQWEETKLAAPAADDVFLRRIWLDLAGVAPPVAEVRRYVADDDPNKRRQLVEQLVASPRFARRLADHWFDILLPEGVSVDQAGQADQLRTWLRRQFAARTPYDRIVARFLTAGGPDDAGPATFYVSLNAQPEMIAAATSEIFLGVKMRCAQCHDHPFASWKQSDFWGYAAFFAQMELDQRGNRQYVRNLMSGDVRHPDSDAIVPASYPGRETPIDERLGSRRKQLAIWMTSPSNPFFARAAVNHAWQQLVGEPLYEREAYSTEDDKSDPRAAALELLAEDFAARGFDIERLYRIIASTNRYAASSLSSDGETLPGAMPVKTLSAAQFFDTVIENIYRRRQAGSLQETRARFLQRMDAPGYDVKAYPHGVTQVLALMNGPEIQAATSGPQAGLLQSLSLPLLNDRDRIEWLFLSTLSRPPTDAEATVFREHLETHATEERQAAFEDMLWALINSTEFAMCP